MASTTYNLSETINLSEEIVTISPTYVTRNLVDTVTIGEVVTADITTRTVILTDTITLGDVFDESHTLRTIRSLESQMAILDVLGTVVLVAINVYIDEVPILLSDVLVTQFTDVVAVPIGDSIILSDSFSLNADKNKNIEDVILLGEQTSLSFITRYERSIEDTIPITDTPVQEYGIRMGSAQGGQGYVDGVTFKSFLAGASGVLSASIPFNHIFFRWLFAKSGIENIYKADTNLVVPAGGGDITPEYINLGTVRIPYASVVTVTDPNDLEYVEDVDGDYISTTETTEVVGDAVAVANKNFTIEQGSNFFNIVTYRNADGDPVDLTGYTAEMQIRKTKESGTILLTLSTSNGYLVLGGVNGTITIDVPASITNALDFVWGRYDLELYPAGVVADALRLLEGKINLSKQVTQ